MGKKTLPKIVRNVQTMIVKHSPEILIGVGITGMLTTTVMAVKATPKALVLIQDAKSRKFDEQLENGKDKDDISNKLTAFEVVKETWKCYIPAGVTGVLSIACLICANSVNTKRNAALATAYTLSETALKEYQEKVVETIGENKEQAVRDKIAKDRIDRDPVTNHEVIITEKGNTLCYDVISGRYFKSDIEKIRKAENILNRRLINEMRISLNEFYYELGLSSTDIGDDLGWDIDDGLIELRFSTQLSDDETPCLVIDYSVAPKYKKWY